MSSADQGFLVHKEPVWRERSNFVINAELPESDLRYKYEQLFVRQIHDDQFEVCCIPFFIYDVNLGDIVQTVAKDERKYVLDRVAQQSGRYTFRTWFGNSFQPREEIASELSSLGALLEWSSRNLLAIDAAGSEQANTIADYLAAHEAAGRLEYETGRS